MTTEHADLKIYAKIALAMLFALLIMAAIFFRERLFGDTSFIAFSVINSGHLSIQEHRYGSFITQMVPVLGARLHLPLNAILIAYTLSFNVFYCIVCSLLVFRYRQYSLAILMACFYSLFVTVSFYWPVNELNQAIAWMFLFFGFVLAQGKKQNGSLLLIIPFLLLAFLTLYTHFVVIIPVAFLWVYLIIDKTHWPFSNQKTLLLSVLLIALVASKFLFVRSNSYDEESLMRITHYSVGDAIRLFSTPVIQMFLKRCITLYWPAMLVLALGMYSLLQQKRMWLVVWTILSLLGCFLVMGLTYGTWDKGALLFHMETEWNCISVIVATPFVFSYLLSIRQHTATIFLIILFGVRLLYIGYASGKMVQRRQYIDNILHKMNAQGTSKLAIIETADIRKDLQLTWSVPYETLLTNAMDGIKPQPVISFIYDQPEKTSIAIATNGFYSDFGVASPSSFDKTYFCIDSTKGYKVMKMEDVMR